MSRAGLTLRQHELLTFLRDQSRLGAISPSVEEMKNALGLASKTGVMRLIDALEERGYISRRRYRARSIALSSTYKVTLSESQDSKLLATAANQRVTPEWLIAVAVEQYLSARPS